MAHFLLLVVAVAGLCQVTAAMNAPSGHYTKQGECQNEKVCQYNYIVNQQYFDGDAKQNITVFASVELSCHTVGVVNATPAIQFCMVVSNTRLQGDVFNEASDQDVMYQERSINQLLSGWFCFVQTSDGKVIAVQHRKDESSDAVDFKKSVAAAFQANFKGTEQEEEDDPQSDHIAHYRYQQNSNKVKKMHRSVSSDDVIDYSTGARKRDIQLMKEEEIEYRDGVLQHSSGDTSFKIQNRHQTETGQEKKLSDAFSAHGSYTLDLQRCYTPNKENQARRKRSLDDHMNQNMIAEERLMANFNITLNERKRLMAIREVIPSVTNALIKLHENLEDRKLMQELDTLLELEYKYGTHKQFRPAIGDVLSYLKSIRFSKKTNDIKMRYIIYSLLSGEGSLKSQMTMLDALQEADETEEKNDIIIQISSIANAHMEFVNLLEQFILTAMEQSGKQSQEVASLLLSFGALASNAQPEVETEVASFLVELYDSLSANDTLELTTLLLAMGNTGSGRVLDVILSYINSSMADLQTASIRALLKFTHLKQVTNRLTEILEMDLPEEIVILITHTVVSGYRYSTDQDIDIVLEDVYPLIQSMISAAIRFNNTDLSMLVEAYSHEIGAEQPPGFSNDLLNARHKRAGTLDWDSTSESGYNLVASLSNRREDVNSYQRHSAYLWTKTLGISRANLKAAAGVFVGLSNDHRSFKEYAKLFAEANLLSRKRTLADVEILLQKTAQSAISGHVFTRIGGNTLVNNRNIQWYRCSTYNTPLTRSRYRLFSFTYSIFVYVGTVGVSIYVDLGVSVSIDAQLCNSSDLRATLGLVPRVSLYAGGSAHVTLLATVRAGISAELTITYQLEPRADSRVCSLSSAQTCARIYESWPGNTIDLYAWYQTRRVRWCRGWFRYPCGFSWGGRRRWSAFDYSWRIGGRSRRPLYSRCYPSITTCSA